MATPETDRYERIIEELLEEFPDFLLLPKAESWLMRALAVLLGPVFGRDTFLTGVTTTVGSTVYTPSDWDRIPVDDRVEILRHERVHMRQMRSYGLGLFLFAYLLLPLPVGLAWFRASLEFEAYEESLRALAESRGLKALNDRNLEFLAELLSGRSYGWAWPFRNYWLRRFQVTRERIVAELSLSESASADTISPSSVP